MPTEPLSPTTGRFLLLGCGSIGKRHLGNLQQLGVRDLAAFDPVAERRHEAQERFGCTVHADLDEAFAAKPRVVLVCTPTRFHLEHALRAARQGCHLFIEKPVAEDPATVGELAAELRQRGLVSLVGCNFRFHPGLQLVRELLAQNTAGRVVTARAQFGQYLPDWHPWEDYRQGYSARQDLGGGVILDRIHELDYLTWLLGDATAVTALVGHLSHLEISTEDTAEILLRFRSGAFGSVHLDYVRRTYDCALEIVGDAGTIQWRYQDHEVRWHTAAGKKWESRQWPGYDGNLMYLDELRHFLRALAGLEPSLQDVAAAARVLTLAYAIKQAALNRAWIEL